MAPKSSEIVPDNDTQSIQHGTMDKTISGGHGDIALNLAYELDAGYEPSPEVERRVRRKIDFILLPLISCTATLSFLDKVSNNYANNVSLIKACLLIHAESRVSLTTCSTASPRSSACTVTSFRGAPLFSISHS